MYRLSFVVIGILIFPLVVLGSNPLDKSELKSIWEDMAKPASERMEAMNLLISNFYDEKSADTTKLFGELLLDFAIKNNAKKYEGLGNYYLGSAAHNFSDNEEAILRFSNAKSIFEEIQDSTLLLEVLNGLGSAYETQGKSDLALSLYNEALEIGRQTGDDKKLIAPLISMGAIREYQGDIKASMEYNLQALELAQLYEVDGKLAVIHNNLGNNYKFFGNIPKASEQYLKSLALHEAEGRVWNVISTLSNLGLLFKDDGDYDKAIEHLSRALELAEENNLEQGKAMSLSNLATVQFAQKKHEIALDNFLKTLEILEANNINFIIPYHLQQIGLLYIELNQWDKAERFLRDGLQKAIEIDRKGDILSGHIFLSKYYSRKGDQLQARKYGEKALDLSNASTFVQMTNDLADHMIEVYKELGQNKAALEMYELRTIISDSLFNEENTRTLVRQEMEYNFAQKSFTDSLKNASILELQKAENERRKSISYLLLAGLGLTSFLGFLLWGRYQITRRQKVELDSANEELNAVNAKLKEIDKSKSRFFTNISHEFRTPLTVISGMADQIDEKSRAKQLIKRNTDQLLQLINQILDLRKLESGKLGLSMIQSDIVAYVRYISESLSSMADQKNVNLSFESNVESLVVDYDPEKLLRIITNLLSNAVKFTSEGGEVKLVFNQFMNGPASKFEIGIEDTGSGIAKEKLPYIFDRFYQVDDSVSKTGEGTGIGLTLTKELVTLLGGTITVNSELTKGTQFIITLPISNNAVLSDGIVKVPVTDLALQFDPEDSIREDIKTTKTTQEDLPSLLLVEDNSDVMEYLKRCLEGKYNLLFAHDGQEGLEKAFEEIPDIIISDVMMPRKDGYTLCHELKTDERTSHIPIILLTAKADTESRITGLQRGADAYLSKPFDQRELEVQLQNLLVLRQRLQNRYSKLEPLEPSEDINIQQEDAFIQKLKEVFHERIDDPEFDLNTLSKSLFLSRSQLGRKVKALTGKSPANYLRFLRLIKAREILKNSDLSVKEVAFDVGFSDPNYFSKSYVEEFGEKPSNAR